MPDILQAPTPPMGGVVDASLLPEMRAKQRQLQNKKVAYIPQAVKDAGVQEQVFIFNIGPRAINCNCASHGGRTIPACKPGEPYSKPLIISGMPYELYNKTGDVLDPMYHQPTYEGDSPGYDFALQIIMGYTEPDGTWKGQSMMAKNSLERFGLGICNQWPPTEDQVAAAKLKRQKTMAALIAEANEAHALGRFRDVATPDHYVAAAELKKTVAECAWLQFSGQANLPAQAEVKPICPNCGEPHNPGVVQHSCGFILNPKQYNAYVEQGLLNGAPIPIQKKA